MIANALWFTVAMLALVAPGVLVTRALGLRERFILGVAVGPVALFQICFLIYLGGVSIRFTPVLIGFVAVCIALALVKPRNVAATSLGRSFAFSKLSLVDGLILLGVAWVACMSLVRGIQSPLSGWDTFWRWEGLSRTILETGAIGFYPPTKAEDFGLYPWPEALPPAVAFVYWWMYAAVGEPLPRLTGVFVALQYAAVLVLVWKLTERHFGRRAAMYAVACAAGCPLLFRSVNIGQETGLLTIALLGVFYFLTTADRVRAVPHVVAAAVCAALAGLCREYGLTFFAFGLCLCVVRRLPWRATLMYVCVVVALVAPWYARTAVLTGNPFYSLNVLALPINTLVVGYLDFNAQLHGPLTWSAARWATEIGHLFLQAPLHVTLLIVAIFFAGRRGFVFAGAVVLVTILWLASIGPTDAGSYFAQRVLGPAMAVGCVLIGPMLDALASRRAGWGRVIPVVLVLVVAWAGAWAASFPLGWPSLRDTSRTALRWMPLTQYGRDKAVELTRLVPRGSRLLAQNNYMQTDLRPLGIDVVQVWSPEVLFLASAEGADPGVVYERLRRANIRYVFLATDSSADTFLHRTLPIYRFDRSRWRAVTSTTDGYTLFELPDP